MKEIFNQEWEDEILTHTKEYLVDMLRGAYTEKNDAIDEVQALHQRVKELEREIRHSY